MNETREKSRCRISLVSFSAIATILKALERGTFILILFLSLVLCTKKIRIEAEAYSTYYYSADMLNVAL